MGRFFTALGEKKGVGLSEEGLENGMEVHLPPPGRRERGITWTRAMTSSKAGLLRQTLVLLGALRPLVEAKLRNFAYPQREREAGGFCTQTKFFFAFRSTGEAERAKFLYSAINAFHAGLRGAGSAGLGERVAACA